MSYELDSYPLKIISSDCDVILPNAVLIVKLKYFSLGRAVVNGFNFPIIGIIAHFTSTLASEPEYVTIIISSSFTNRVLISPSDTIGDRYNTQRIASDCC